VEKTKGDEYFNNEFEISELASLAPGCGHSLACPHTRGKLFLKLIKWLKNSEKRYITTL